MRFNFSSITVLIAILVMVSGCSLMDGTSPTPGFSLPSRVPDPAGNLVVNNQSNTDLVLFRGDQALKTIPHGSLDFLVDIALSTDPEEVQLELFKSGDVADSSGKPSDEMIYRSWDVPLVRNASLPDRRTWQVSSDSSTTARTTGTLTLIPTDTNNFVRVYNGDLSGAKLGTLSFLSGNLVLGLEYGTYRLFYQYVHDDGQGTGSTVAGSVDRETINGESVPIYVVLKANRDSETRHVPCLTADAAPLAAYASLRICNQSSLPAHILVDGQLVETLMYLGDGNSQNASDVAHGETADYTIPAGHHTLQAMDPEGRIIRELTMDLPAGTCFDWIIPVSSLKESVPPGAVMDPPNGSSGIPVTSSIRVTFSEAVGRSLAEAAFSLKDSTGRIIVGSFGWNAASTVMEFTPSARLGSLATFAASLDASVRDLQGNPMAHALDSHFTTAVFVPPELRLEYWVQGDGDNSTLGSGLAVRFLGSDALWHDLDVHTGPVDSLTGSSVSLVITDPRAFHADLKIRFATTPSRGNAGWYRVDNVSLALGGTKLFEDNFSAFAPGDAKSIWETGGFTMYTWDALFSGWLMYFDGSESGEITTMAFDAGI